MHRRAESFPWWATRAADRATSGTTTSIALYDELKTRGVTIDYELCDRPYGCREFGIRDLDWYDIAFGQDMDADS